MTTATQAGITSFDESVIAALKAAGLGSFGVQGFNYHNSDTDETLQIVDRDTYEGFARDTARDHSNPDPTTEEIETSWANEHRLIEVEGTLYAFILQ